MHSKHTPHKQKLQESDDIIHIRHFPHKETVIELYILRWLTTEKNGKYKKMEPIVSQPRKSLKFMTFREMCFLVHLECMYLSEALETLYRPQF